MNTKLEACTHLFFEALSSPLRLKIVEVLMSGSKSVSELSGLIGAEQSRVSHALTALTDCKLVKCKKEGKSRIYSIADPIVENIIKMVIEYECRTCKSCSRLAKKQKRSPI